jgi:hypothetical protein
MVSSASRAALTIALTLGLVVLFAAPASADCPPGSEFCFDGGAGGDGGKPPGGGASGCWSPELGKDTCNTPPEPCPPTTQPPFVFSDDKDGTDDGQLVALNDGKVPCGTLRVDKTGYYRIFDLELSESCAKQKDETGWVTIANSCNPDGWAIEANADKRFLIVDADNTNDCSKDSECAGGLTCRDGTNGGRCCVSPKPTFMGTFLLVAGEDNEVCLHHWCPIWSAEKAKSGQDLGFVTADCKGINSIHFRIGADAIACADDTELYPCTFGCQAGKCLPDPCIAANCPGFCKDGLCLDENPCAGLSCQHGCDNGRCLQAPTTPAGEDRDGDGYRGGSDCDDDDPAVNPSAREICGNSKDDDCDGAVDESDCSSSSGFDGSPGSGASGAADEGCGCGVESGAARGWPLALVLLCLGLWSRGRERRER